METSELHTEVDEGKEIFRIQRKLHRSEKNVNERSGIAEIPSVSIFCIVFKVRGSRTLTTAQQEKIQERPVLGKNNFTEQLVSGSYDEKIKLQRAQGGCPGTIRRRRTWQAAKSYGEPQAGTDP